MALGYRQVSGVDVFSIFAPVMKGITVRLLLAPAFILNMYMHEVDVSNDCCYADIEGDVYRHPTPDFELPSGYCFKLQKSLYGQRSSPRYWWKNLDKYIKSLHFVPCLHVVFAWGSHLQATVATSSMESEYQEMYAGMQVAVWFRRELSEILLPLREPMPIFLDSQSAEDSNEPRVPQKIKAHKIKVSLDKRTREHVDPVPHSYYAMILTGK